MVSEGLFSVDERLAGAWEKFPLPWETNPESCEETDERRATADPAGADLQDVGLP